MGGHFADDMGLMSHLRRTRVGGPSIGFYCRAGGKAGGNEGMDACGGIIGDRGEADAARTVPGACLHDLDGADHGHFTHVAASGAPGDGFIPGPVRDRRFVDFHQAVQQVTLRIDHRVAELGA